MGRLTTAQKKKLVPELRKMYEICVGAGYVPSSDFVALGRQLNAESTSMSSGRSDDDDAEALYQEQSRETVEGWLESVESNVEMEGRGGTGYSDKEKEFIEDMRAKLVERSGDRPLTGRQLKWLKSLYDRS